MSVTLGKRQTKRGLRYFVQWTEPGKDGKVDRKTETVERDPRWSAQDYRHHARLARLDKAAELRRRKRGKSDGSDRHLSHLRDELAVWMAHRAPATLRKSKGSIQQLIDVVGDLTLAGVDRRALMEFRAARIEDKAKPATVNKDLRHIKSALSYAVDAGWLSVNPLLRWKDMFVREPDKVVRVVEPADFNKLLEKCTWKDFEALITLAYYQGLRRSELVHLRWGDVDMQRETLTVANRSDTGEFTKSRRNRTVPLRSASLKALQEQWDRVGKVVADGKVSPKCEYIFAWSDGTPLKADWVTHEFDRVSTAAGLECTLHDLRRSFSTLAQRAGVDRSVVKDMGGWSCLAVVEKHYTGEIAETYRRAVKRMDGVA